MMAYSGAISPHGRDTIIKGRGQERGLDETIKIDFEAEVERERISDV